MPGGPHDAPRDRSEEKARHVFAKAGCERETFARIASYVRETFPGPEERGRKLSEIGSFVSAIGRGAARDYFRAIKETGAIAELTDPKLLTFARSVDPHTAEWYFWAIWGTKAVRELTDERVLNAVDFFRSIEGSATVEYFLSIRETKAAARLTDPKVLEFARSIGSDAAVEYFGAFWETNAIDALTSERVLSFARSLKGDAAKEYFLAIRETKAVSDLTDDRVLGFVRSVGPRVAEEYFRAIHESGSAEVLTSDRVTVFAEVIGRACAREYFRVIGSTKKVAELTSEGLLRGSAVIRAIGSDAALDYFLAVASADVVPAPTEPRREAISPPTETLVPILTLLDIPNYKWLRPTAMFGATALFWWGVSLAGSLALATSHSLVGLLVVAAAWGLLLWAAYLLAGTIAERSTGEFLRQRRRLLNEHGIRWHDCLSGDQRCSLCWNSTHTHEDDRFDYGRFCRCPAC